MAINKRDVLLPVTSHGRDLIGVSVLFSVTVILFVGLRMLRNLKFRKFGWDEGLILFAMLVQLATCGLMIASVAYGGGRHVYEFRNLLYDSFMAVQLPWISHPLAIMALMFAKISLAITLLKIGLGRVFNSIIIVTLVIVSIADIWSVVTIVAGCRPSRDANAGPCGASQLARGVSYFLGASNILIDIIFFAAPEFFLRKTKLSARDRMAVRIILSFMFLATIMSILKLIYLQTLLIKGDITWYYIPVSAAAVAESGFAIMAACLPAVRQLAGQRFPKQLAFWKTISSKSSATRGSRAAYRPQSSPKPDVEYGSFGTDDDGSELVAFGATTKKQESRYDSVPNANKAPSMVSENAKYPSTSSKRFDVSSSRSNPPSARPESQEPILNAVNDREHDKEPTSPPQGLSLFPRAYVPLKDRIGDYRNDSRAQESRRNETVTTAPRPSRSSSVLDKGEGFIPLYYQDKNDPKPQTREVYQHF